MEQFNVNQRPEIAEALGLDRHQWPAKESRIKRQVVCRKCSAGGGQLERYFEGDIVPIGYAYRHRNGACEAAKGLERVNEWKRRLQAIQETARSMARDELDTSRRKRTQRRVAQTIAGERDRLKTEALRSPDGFSPSYWEARFDFLDGQVQRNEAEAPKSPKAIEKLYRRWARGQAISRQQYDLLFREEDTEDVAAE